ncbi:MAG: glycosyltransferase [Eubacteriales bacterium]
MKILLYAVHAEEKGWRQIAAELAAKGHEIVLLSAKALNKCDDGIKNICVKRLREIKKICKYENPYAVCVYVRYAACFAARFAGAERIIYVPAAGKKTCGFLFRHFFRRYKLPDLFCAKPPDTEPERRAEFKNELGISPKARLFLALGSAEAESDLRTFLLASSEAAKQNSSLAFALSADGSLGESLAALRADLDFSERIFFLPKERSAGDLIAAADAIVASSLPLKDRETVASALGAGIPLLLSDRCGEYIPGIEGKAGLVFEHGNSEALATAMCALAENDSLFLKLQNGATELFRNTYSAEKAASDIERLILSENKK